jgi:predicted acetyltransferase
MHIRTDDPAFEPVWDDVPSATELLAVYECAAKRYSGCVVRSEAEMQKRMNDLLCDGGKCMVHRANGVPDGYLFASEEDGVYSCEEALALSQSAYAVLVSRLPKGARVKLPPDVALTGVRYRRA